MFCDVASASAMVTIASQRCRPVAPAQGASRPGCLMITKQISVASTSGLNTPLRVVALSIASLSAAHEQTAARARADTDGASVKTTVLAACMTDTLFERSQPDQGHVTPAGRATWRMRHSGGSAFPRHIRHPRCPWPGKRQGPDLCPARR